MIIIPGIGASGPAVAARAGRKSGGRRHLDGRSPPPGVSVYRHVAADAGVCDVTSLPPGVRGYCWYLFY